MMSLSRRLHARTRTHILVNTGQRRGERQQCFPSSRLVFSLSVRRIHRAFHPSRVLNRRQRGKGINNDAAGLLIKSHFLVSKSAIAIVRVFRFWKGSYRPVIVFIPSRILDGSHVVRDTKPSEVRIQWDPTWCVPV